MNDALVIQALKNVVETNRNRALLSNDQTETIVHDAIADAFEELTGYLEPLVAKDEP